MSSKIKNDVKILYKKNNEILFYVNDVEIGYIRSFNLEESFDSPQIITFEMLCSASIEKEE